MQFNSCYIIDKARLHAFRKRFNLSPHSDDIVVQHVNTICQQSSLCTCNHRDNRLPLTVLFITLDSAVSESLQQATLHIAAWLFTSFTSAYTLYFILLFIVSAGAGLCISLHKMLVRCVIYHNFKNPLSSTICPSKLARVSRQSAHSVYIHFVDELPISCGTIFVHAVAWTWKRQQHCRNDPYNRFVATRMQFLKEEGCAAHCLMFTGVGLRILTVGTAKGSLSTTR